MVPTMQETSTKRSTERAFVVQFDPDTDGRTPFRGRVEMVASGEAARFRSRKQLIALLAASLDRPARREVEA
jgi:hypothetical protein